jgi:hypothetical protein
MTKMTLTVDTLQGERRVADHRINVQESDRTAPIAANVIANAWMLAIYYSIFHYLIAESIVRINAEAIAAVTCALGSTDAGAKFEEEPGDPEGFDARSVGDLMASDRRRIACKTLGGAFEGNLTKSLRRDLILASSVVC